MKLIRNLPTKIINGRRESYALFWCGGCNQEVEKPLSQGKRDMSCGCMQKEFNRQAHIKHGESNTRLYTIWALIKQRCLNIKNKDYLDYGGRGIIICNEWLEFIPFRDWSLNNGYADNLEIDRIKNDLGYCPENCHFITGKENRQKTRRIKLTQEIANEIRELHRTGKYTQKELAEKYGVNRVTISLILNNKRWGNIV